MVMKKKWVLSKISTHFACLQRLFFCTQTHFIAPDKGLSFHLLDSATIFV